MTDNKLIKFIKIVYNSKEILINLVNKYIDPEQKQKQRYFNEIEDLMDLKIYKLIISRLDDKNLS